MFKNVLIILILLTISVVPCKAANENTGTTRGTFLKLNGGVRAESMGGAFIAVADDPSAMYWNPAGITQMEFPELSSTYTSWLAGINSASVSLARPLGRWAFGLSYNYLAVGGIEETTAGQPAGTGRVFSPTDSSLSLAFAHKLRPNLAVGLNAKTINENIDDAAASGYAMDLGVLWKPRQNLSVGISARNFVGDLAGGALPVNYGIGLSFKLSRLLVAADFNVPNDDQSTINIGAEYEVNDFLFGRVGYNTRNERDAGGYYGLGVGLLMRGAQFDYAYVPYGELGSTHRFSLGLEFGRPAEKKIIKEKPVEPAKPPKKEVVVPKTIKPAVRKPILLPRPWKYDPNLALEIYNDLLKGKKYPANYKYENWQLKKLLSYKAVSAEKKKDYDKAVEYYALILQIDPLNPYAFKKASELGLYAVEKAIISERAVEEPVEKEMPYGKLVIVLDDSRAAVFVDGKLKGFGTVTIDEILEGSHYLQVKFNEIVIQEQMIDVEKGKQTTIVVKIPEEKKWMGLEWSDIAESIKIPLCFSATYGRFNYELKSGGALVSGTYNKDVLGLGLGVRPYLDNEVYYSYGYHYFSKSQNTQLSYFYLDYGRDNGTMFTEFGINYPYFSNGTVQDVQAGASAEKIEGNIGYQISMGWNLTDHFALGAKYGVFRGSYTSSSNKYDLNLSQGMVYLRNR